MKNPIKIMKTKSFALIIIALMITSVTFIAMPIQPVKAQVVTQAQTTYSTAAGYPSLGPLLSGVNPVYKFAKSAYISVTPSPVGLNQQMLINVWTQPGMVPSFYDQGYTVNIIKPDGTKETLGPVNSYMADSTYWWLYNANQVGTWQFQFVSAGTYIPAGNYTSNLPALPPSYYSIPSSVYYAPCSTPWYNVTVQQDFVPSWPTAALPSAGDYWTRPVNPMNREWWTIAGNYPFSGSITYPNGQTFFASNYHSTPYVQAPNSCHVVWMKQNALSGLIGGTAYISTIFSNPGTPSIIYDGRCYQTITKQMLTLVNGTYIYQPISVWECYDLRTGEVYWDLTGITTPPTYILYELGTGEAVPGADAGNGYTVTLAAISGGRLLEYNPLTGACTVNASLPNGITSGTLYGDPYVVSVQTLGSGATVQYRLINWTIAGWTSTTTFASKMISNVSWTAFTNYTSNMLGQTTVYDYDNGIAAALRWQVTTGPLSSFNLGNASGWCFGYYLVTADMRTGAVILQQASNDTLIYNNQEHEEVLVHNGKVAMCSENGYWNCYDARTGQHLWTSDSSITDFPWNSTSPDYPWGAFWAYYASSYDINDTCSEIIGCSYAGLFAFNWADGKMLWHYYDNNTVPFESPYGGNSFFTGNEMADGKVYAYAGEHSPSEPINRGWDTICLNATTGDLMWHIKNTMVPGAVADGYLTAGNQDDGYMYVFGIGKSSTTVTTPDTAVLLGIPVVIKGTVLDESPAQPGTPCVSKESMDTQMEYLHMQQPLDGLWHNTTMTGVPVVLTAIGSNNNVIDIGSTTTNAYDGTFGMSWTPPSAGTYHITASFAGDDSYGSSSAGDTLVVAAAAPSPTTTTTTAPTLQTDNTGLIYSTTAIIVAIIIVGIALALVIRRRP